MMNDPFGNAPTQETDDDDFNVDLPEDESLSFCIPEGPHMVEVANLEKATSEAGNNMWVWYLEVCEGPHQDHELRVYTALTPAAMWKLREVLEALGLGQSGRSSKFKRQDAIGRKCWANVVDDEYKGVKRSSVDSLSPIRQQAPVADATMGGFNAVADVDDTPF